MSATRNGCLALWTFALAACTSDAEPVPGHEPSGVERSTGMVNQVDLRFGGFAHERAADERSESRVDSIFMRSTRRLERTDYFYPAYSGEAIGGVVPLAPDPPTWKPSRLASNTTRLQIGDRTSLPLEQIDASVRIDGFRARVLLDLTFHNTHPRSLEGSFQLRLPDGASPFFLAFGEAIATSAPLPAPTAAALQPEAILSGRAKAWKNPKVARIVPRERAADAYRRTVQRAVDPALAEWRGPSIFSCRVFPLGPNQRHRIVVGYDVDLLPQGPDLVYRLQLPPAPRSQVVLDAGGAPRITASPYQREARPQGRWRWSWTSPRRQRVEVRLRGVDRSLLAGRDPTGRYFAASLPLQLPPSEAAARPARGVFVVDVSLSANGSYATWLKLLEAILERNRPSLKSFAVLFFSLDARWWRPGFAPNTRANVRALLADARDLACEGATDVGSALREAASPSWGAGPEARDLFLLSDGVATWGQADPLAIARRLGEHTVFAYRTETPGADLHGLADLTRRRGGAVFSVSPASLAKVATAHRRRPWLLERLELTGTSDLLLAGRPTALYPNQRLRLVGRGRPQAAAPLVLHLKQGSERKVVRLPLPEPLASPLAVRAYGQTATAQLERLRTAPPKATHAYARHFRVTGKSCSLLMLESKEDYERFGIVPKDDARVVQQLPAEGLLTRALASLERELGDPRAELLRLAKAAQADLAAVIRAIPKDAVDPRPGPLRITHRTWAGVPAQLKAQLSGNRPTQRALDQETRRRLAKYGVGDALRVASSWLDAHPGDPVAVHDLAYTARSLGLPGQAARLLLRTGRGLAATLQTAGFAAESLEAAGRLDLALVWHELALRHSEASEVARLRYLRFLLHRARTTWRGLSSPKHAQRRLAELSKTRGALTTVDLAVLVEWNTDGTDVDLHVTEPSGEECSYEHTRTRQGGMLSADITTGHGPELYVIPKAQAGTYRVRVKYYRADRNRTETRTRVHVTIYRGWASARERVTRKVIELRSGGQVEDVAAVALD